MNDSDVYTDRHLDEDEETIQKTIHYLELHDPANANREYAIGFLKFMERVAFQVEKKQDLSFDDLLVRYRESDVNFK